MRFLILAFIYCLSQQINAQPRKIVVQIDNLKGSARIKKMLDFHVWVSDGEEIIEHNLEYGPWMHADYVGWYLLHSDSAVIYIPVDVNGSYISITDIYSMKADTVRISSLRLQRMNVEDTVYCTELHYKLRNGQEDELVQSKKTFTTSKGKIPNHVELIINDVKYRADFLRATKPSSPPGIAEITLACSRRYKPKKYLDEQGNYKKKAKMIAYSINRKHYPSSATIKVKK